MIPSTLPPAPDQVDKPPRRRRRRVSSLLLAAAVSLSALLLSAAPASAWVGTPDEGLGKYWLPPNYSEHGDDVDMLFIWIFWITMIIFVVVEIVLVVFMVKYRSRPDRKKGIFTHGNTKLEMTWTLAPAVILIGLALYTKRVWDIYRYGDAAQAENKTKLLVIGQQFKWNVVYPGPDGVLGTYLSYPRTTDPAYAWMPYDQAKLAVENHIRNENPLGRKIDPNNKADPGLDDDWPKFPGRAVLVPVGRPLEISLSSKDVLHDFFLPNFRVKLDAVPNLHGKIHFMSRKQSTSLAPIPVDQVSPEARIWLDQDVPVAKLTGDKAMPADRKWTVAEFDPKLKKRGRTLLSNFDTLNDAAKRRVVWRNPDVKPPDVTPEMIARELPGVRADLAAAGVAGLTVIETPFEIVCEELCGGGHATMNGEFLVLSGKQYDDFINREQRGKEQESSPKLPGATQPVAAAPRE